MQMLTIADFVCLLGEKIVSFCDAVFVVVVVVRVLMQSVEWLIV